MSVPPEYTQARNALIAFRSKILNDLVSARVKAGLDASHDSMTKYGNVIDGLAVEGYMYGELRRKALALQFKGMNLGSGTEINVGMTYQGSEQLYPKHTPYELPQRYLPRVDQFVYTPLTDMELLEKTDVEGLKSFLLIQVGSDAFEEEPDAENAIYDYYSLYPVYRSRAEYNLSGIVGGILYTKIKGEMVRFYRQLTAKGTITSWRYYLDLWLDCEGYANTTYKTPIALLTWMGCIDADPLDCVYVIGTQRVTYGTKAVYFAPSLEGTLRGFVRMADSMTLVGETFEWFRPCVVEVTVNDETMGTTTPIPPNGEGTYVATTNLVLVGHPYSGYVVDHWERDGVVCTYSNTYTLFVHKDHNMKCVFKAG